MDIIVLIIACFWVSKKAKEKDMEPRQWVLRLIGWFILFEIIGVGISWSLTHNLVMAGIFGFFCALGALLLMKYRLERS
jgi:hypothetical protein